MRILTRDDFRELGEGPTMADLAHARQWVAEVAEKRGTTVEKLTKGMETAEVYRRYLRRQW
jgi:hypothetical protein